VLFVLGALLALNNSLTTTADLSRNQITYKAWEPYVWEYSSFVVIFALYALVIQVTVRWPLFFHQRWPWHLLIHATASVVFSVSHVVLMVLIRKAIYQLTDGTYDFGDWATELVYEYRKDVLTYFTFVLIYTGWKYWIRIQTQQSSDPPVRLKVTHKKGTRWVALAEIISIESGGNYIYLHTRDEVLPMRGTMKTIMDELNPQQFIRVHRSYIINTLCIEKLTDLSKDPCKLVLVNGKKVPVSRTYRAELMAIIDQPQTGLVVN